jgi:hypothetical protein
LRNAHQQREFDKALGDHQSQNAVLSIIDEFRDERRRLTTELEDIENRFPTPRSVESWRQIHYEQMRMIERSSGRLMEARDRADARLAAQMSEEYERDVEAASLPQPTRRSARTTRAEVPRTPSPVRRQGTAAEDIADTPIRASPPARPTACRTARGGDEPETAAEELARRARTAREHNIAEVARLMGELDSVVEVHDHLPAWEPPSQHELRTIDPIYRMGPEVKLFPQVSPEDPAFATISRDNDRIREYNKRRTLIIDRVDRQEMLRIFLAAKITPGGVCALQRNGFYTALDMANIGSDSLDEMIKAYNKDRSTPFDDRIPACALSKLHAFTKWAKEQRAHGLPLHVESYRVNNLEAHYVSKLQATEASRLDKTKDGDLVGKPPTFSESLELRVWKYQCEMYLHSQTGVDQVPLAYVIREEEQAMPYDKTVDMSSHDRLVATTPLQGTYYETDNKRVFWVLSNATIGTTAEAEISDITRATRNGRAAWKALTSRFGGEMYVIAQAKKAYEPQKNNQFDASKDLKHLGRNWSMYLSSF